MQFRAILETESDTESWLPLQFNHTYVLHLSFVFILIIQKQLRPL